MNRKGVNFDAKRFEVPGGEGRGVQTKQKGTEAFGESFDTFCTKEVACGGLHGVGSFKANGHLDDPKVDRRWPGVSKPSKNSRDGL